MAIIPSQLPATQKEWLKAVRKHNLVGQTVHTAELASASKMDFRQFLLLHILWAIHTGEQSFKLPEVLKPYLIQAIELLAACQAWISYCTGIEYAEFPLDSFASARYYQIEVVQSGQKMRLDGFDTPIAKRTRNQTRRKLEEEFRKLQVDKTPSKDPTQASRPPYQAGTSSVDPLAPETPQPPPTPITPAAQVPEELQKEMFTRTKDETIVATALLVFLNALTFHFNIIKRCKWSMYRKPFIAQFEEAKFESRVDGFLDDGKETPWAPIEVKPVIRYSRVQSKIQIQEGAETANGIRNDIDAPVDKLRVQLSQDRHETFITIAEYGSDYVSKRSPQTTSHWNS